MDVLNHNFIRLGLTRAKALQTASRFPRETRRRFAVPKSNAFTLICIPASYLIVPYSWSDRVRTTYGQEDRIWCFLFRFFRL